MLKVKHRGSFNHLERLLHNITGRNYLNILEKYGEAGVNALAEATPSDTGRTASMWSYTIEQTATGVTIYWSNANENDGVPIAVILQYGHGTGSGGFVQGRDYINPSVQPIFDQIAEEAWREVII